MQGSESHGEWGYTVLDKGYEEASCIHTFKSNMVSKYQAHEAFMNNFRGEVSIAEPTENLPVHQVKLGIQNEELHHTKSR